MGEWIEWAGGEQPVADDVGVDVKLGNNDPSEDAGSADSWLWEHTPEAVAGDYHITAYRVTA